MEANHVLFPMCPVFYSYATAHSLKILLILQGSPIQIPPAPKTESSLEEPELQRKFPIPPVWYELLPPWGDPFSPPVALLLQGSDHDWLILVHATQKAALYRQQHLCCCCLVAESCLTHCNSMDCNWPGSSVHGISQARILWWVAISFSRGSSQSREQTHVSCRQILYHWAT